MAQFDSLIIFPLVWSTLLVLSAYYSVSIEILIPNFFGTRKFREKKLNLLAFYSSLRENLKVKSSRSYSTVS